MPTDRIELTALSTRALLALARQYRNDGPSHTRRAACDAYRAAVSFQTFWWGDQEARDFAIQSLTYSVGVSLIDPVRVYLAPVERAVANRIEY